jgi:hypothetical protein
MVLFNFVFCSKLTSVGPHVLTLLPAQLIGGKRALVWCQIGRPAAPDREARPKDSLIPADQTAPSAAFFCLTSVCVCGRDFDKSRFGGLNLLRGRCGWKRQACGLPR